MLIRTDPGDPSRDRRERSANDLEIATYLITFSTYGAHIHGDSGWSVDRKHNVPGTPMLEENSARSAAERSLMHQPAYVMDQNRRQIIRAAVMERSVQSGWSLIALHVRTNHVHVVLAASARGERIMKDLKSYSSRRLNESGIDVPGRKRWARHGSVRILFDRRAVDNAVVYVIDRQGPPMETYLAPIV